MILKIDKSNTSQFTESIFSLFLFIPFYCLPEQGRHVQPEPHGQHGYEVLWHHYTFRGLPEQKKSFEGVKCIHCRFLQDFLEGQSADNPLQIMVNAALESPSPSVLPLESTASFLCTASHSHPLLDISLGWWPANIMLNVRQIIVCLTRHFPVYWTMTDKMSDNVEALDITRSLLDMSGIFREENKAFLSPTLPSPYILL